MKKLIIFAVMILIAATGIQSQQDINNPNDCTKTDIVVEHTDVILPPSLYYPPTDTDKDGIPDFVEGDDDCDGDGIPNFQDTDSDNDGLSDRFESWSDLDEDGIMNICDLDSDGDGVLDAVDKCYDKKGIAPFGCPTSDGDRHVFWVHGYSGSAGAWQKAGNYSKNTYKIQSDYIDYSNNQSNLEDEAEEIKQDILEEVGYNINNQNNFIIAHSGGSIASRVLGQAKDYSGNNAFNGFITFGGPHQGVVAADFLETPGNKEKVIKEICSDLGEGPYLEFNTIIGLGWTTGLQYTILEELGVGWSDLCSVMPKLVESYIDDMLLGVEPQLTTDYIQNNVAPMQTQHNAAFYGIETDTDDEGDIDETLTPRFLGNFLVNANDFPLWGAGQADQVGINLFHNVFTFYKNRRDFWYGEWDDCWVLCDSEWNKYKGYRKGVNYLKNFNSTWKSIIGAEVTELQKIGCQCCEYIFDEESQHFLWYCEDIDCDDLPNCKHTPRVKYRRVAVHKPSDGFVLVESAMNAPGANYPPHEMIGSGHFQMKNDQNTKIATELIFDEGLNKSFFQTDRR